MISPKKVELFRRKQREDSAGSRGREPGGTGRRVLCVQGYRASS